MVDFSTIVEFWRWKRRWRRRRIRVHLYSSSLEKPSSWVYAEENWPANHHIIVAADLVQRRIT
jgi:hypothetical protein